MGKKAGAIAVFAGTTVAFFIGSGFATAQEIMQYFAAYGWQFLLVIFVSMAIFIYTNHAFIRAGADGAMAKPGGIFVYYCGRWLGGFYDVFTTIFVFLSFIVMCGGAGAAVSQQFGLPRWVGAFSLAALTALTVVLGMDGLVRVLGRLGPVVVVSILLIGIVTIVRDRDQLAAGVALVESGQVALLKVGTNFFSSAVSYAGFVMLWFCTFMAELGSRNNPRLVRAGMGIGSAVIALALAVVSMALLCNIRLVSASDIPSMVLAAKISPIWSMVFVWITLCGTYTASVPLLWTVSRRYCREGTVRFRVVTALLALISAVIALFLPYKQLVNLVYGINGYVGIALVFFLIRKDILRRRHRQ